MGGVTDSDLNAVTTARLLVRPPREADRDRFVELFGNEDFMAFYPRGALIEEEANDRFDHMVAVCQAIPFGKQPVVELSSGLIVGYTGVDSINLEGRKAGMGLPARAGAQGPWVRHRGHRGQRGPAGQGSPGECG